MDEDWRGGGTRTISHAFRRPEKSFRTEIRLSTERIAFANHDNVTMLNICNDTRF